MIGGCVVDVIGLFSVLEVGLDVGKERGLVCFDDEMIVGLTVFHQIACKIALGQEGVGGNHFALDVDSVKERGGRFDLVGSLELLIAFFGEGAYFFWV